MIQRIQSLFLALSAVASASTVFLPFAFLSHGSEGVFSDSQLNAQDNIGLYLAFGGAALLALIALFLFKNRKLQATLSSLTVLLLVLGTSLAGYLLWQSGKIQEILWGVAWAMPVISAVLALLARRYIKRDERLVRSMDRLR